MILYMLRDGYLCFAAVLDAPVRIQQHRLSSFDHRFDFLSTTKLVSCIGSVQFVFWTLTYRAVVGWAHGRVRNLKPVHAQQVPETPPLPHLSVCKSKMPVHRTQLIDLGNDRVHAAVVEVQAPVPLPRNIVVGAWSRLQYGQQAKGPPSERLGHDTTVVVQTSHCANMRNQNNCIVERLYHIVMILMI